MAARVLGARALTFFALVVAGCSGAANQDLFEGTPGQDEQSDTSATQPAPSPSATTPSAPSAPTPPPPPAPSAKDAGPDPAPEPVKCTPEAESNNDIGKANNFTTSFCGKIDSVNDVDFARFVAPPGMTSLSIKHAEKDGKVGYRYYVSGAALPAGVEIVKVVPGTTYAVQMKLASGSNGGDRPTYELEISFSK